MLGQTFDQLMSISVYMKSESQECQTQGDRKTITEGLTISYHSKRKGMH